MKESVKKLKRYNALQNVLGIICLPITLVLWLFITLGDFAERTHELISIRLNRFIRFVAKKYKWEEIADERRT